LPQRRRIPGRLLLGSRELMDWHVLLVITAALFGGFVIFKFRPVISTARGSKGARARLRDAKERVSKASSQAERALALADAADAATPARSAAIGYYLRAMRLDPTSVVLVNRAAAALARRPRALESLLWRRLGAAPWTGPTRDAALASVRHLARLYAGPIRSAVRARALEHAALAIGAPNPAATSPLEERDGG